MALSLPKEPSMAPTERIDLRCLSLTARAVEKQKVDFFFSGGQGALSWFYSQKMTLSRGHFTDVILVTIGGWVVLR